MKIIGRILIILIVFLLVMGIIYLIVNARSSATSGFLPGLGQANGRFAPADGSPPRFENGERPEFPDGGREFRGERDGGEWLFGTLRNIVIIGMIVALIVVPKSWIRKRKRAAQSAAG